MRAWDSDLDGIPARNVTTFFRKFAARLVIAVALRHSPRRRARERQSPDWRSLERQGRPRPRRRSLLDFVAPRFPPICGAPDGWRLPRRRWSGSGSRRSSSLLVAASSPRHFRPSSHFLRLSRLMHPPPMLFVSVHSKDS